MNQVRELNCQEVARILQRYLDRELDPVVSVAVARHLEDCRECGLEASTYEQLKHSLATLSQDLDAGAVERLRHFVDELAESERRT